MVRIDTHAHQEEKKQPSHPTKPSSYRRPRTPVESQILRHATVLQQLPLRQPPKRQPPKRRLAAPLPRTTDYRHLPKKPNPRGCGGAGASPAKKSQLTSTSAHTYTKDHRRRKMNTCHGRPPPDATRRLLPKNVEYTPAQGYTRILFQPVLRVIGRLAKLRPQLET